VITDNVITNNVITNYVFTWLMSSICDPFGKHQSIFTQKASLANVIIFECGCSCSPCNCFYPPPINHFYPPSSPPFSPLCYSLFRTIETCPSRSCFFISFQKKNSCEGVKKNLRKMVSSLHLVT
jgi:hypothetical protein